MAVTNGSTNGAHEENVHIPVIDISPSNPDAPQQLLSAAQHFGFVFVANNNQISPNLIERMFEISQEFFALPVAEKEKVSIASNKVGKNFGWLSQGVEKLSAEKGLGADVKEAFNMSPSDPKTGEFQQLLPPPLQANLDTVLAFQSACADLCTTLLTHFATALRIPDKTWFTQRHDRTLGPSGTVFRMLYYPHHPTQDEKDIRAGAHSDFGSVTALFQLPGQPGLEILTPKGNWAAVPVNPLANSNSDGDDNDHNNDNEGPLPILINIGDLLEDWTCELLKSTKHRVVFPTSAGGGEDRYSMAYFCQPLDAALLEPVPSPVVEAWAAENGKKWELRRKDGRVMTAGDHLMDRLAATYKIEKH